MEFNIRVLTDDDYANTLSGWWEAWRWTAPPKDSLPDNGKGGVMILDGDIPVCAGFMYATNSSIAWIEFIISNKEYRNKGNRKAAIELLIDTLINTAKTSGFTYCYSVLKNKHLLDVYDRSGFVRGDNSIEMVKIL